MKLEQRIDLLKSLGEYCLSSEPAWEEAKRKANAANGWFIPEFVDEAIRRIVAGYLQPDQLAAWADHYAIPPEKHPPRTVGECPLYAAFVDRIIGALRFAGAAIDAFFSYLNSHFLKIGGD